MDLAWLSFRMHCEIHSSSSQNTSGRGFLRFTDVQQLRLVQISSTFVKHTQKSFFKHHFGFPSFVRVLVMLRQQPINRNAQGPPAEWNPFSNVSSHAGWALTRGQPTVRTVVNAGRPNRSCKTVSVGPNLHVPENIAKQWRYTEMGYS